MTRGRAVWILCYAYLAYVFFAAASELGNLPIFSVQAASALFVVLFLFSSYVSWGTATATKYLVGTWVVSYAIEFVGVTTGFPFGSYAYSSVMGPSIGPVPVFIPFLWCALGYFSLRAAGVSILAPAVMMTLLDLSFDPIFSRTLWHWRSTIGPEYFGVPVMNFVGWFATAAVVFALFSFARRGRPPSSKKSVLLAGGSAEGVGFYFLFGMSNVVSLVTGGLPEAAAASTALFAASGLVLWWARAKGESAAVD